MTEITADQWDEFISSCEAAHLLQTSEWGELKSNFGWEPVRVVTDLHWTAQRERSGAQMLFRKMPFGYSMAYIPKGPVFAPVDLQKKPAHWERLLSVIDELCRHRKAIFLKVELDRLESGWNAEADQEKHDIETPEGFIPNRHTIQPARTILVDLRGDEKQILGRMKQKTRYNIRLAQKRGIVVTTSSDLNLFHRMMVATGRRDKFGFHSREYYQLAYDLFYPSGRCELFVAEYQSEPVACLMVFAHGQRAWYFYGASTDLHRELMPTYLLQWEAMRWARDRGCLIYDLWGIPDYDVDTLEANFTLRSEGLWGVYRFKRGFGGEVRRAVDPLDRIYHPALYSFFQLWLRLRAPGEGQNG